MFDLSIDFIFSYSTHNNNLCCLSSTFITIKILLNLISVLIISKVLSFFGWWIICICGIYYIIFEINSMIATYFYILDIANGDMMNVWVHIYPNQCFLIICKSYLKVKCFGIFWYRSFSQICDEYSGIGLITCLIVMIIFKR